MSYRARVCCILVYKNGVCQTNIATILLWHKIFSYLSLLLNDGTVAFWVPIIDAAVDTFLVVVVASMYLRTTFDSKNLGILMTIEIRITGTTYLNSLRLKNIHGNVRIIKTSPLISLNNISVK